MNLALFLLLCAIVCVCVCVCCCVTFHYSVRYHWCHWHTLQCSLFSSSSLNWGFTFSVWSRGTILPQIFCVFTEPSLCPWLIGVSLSLYFINFYTNVLIPFYILFPIDWLSLMLEALSHIIMDICLLEPVLVIVNFFVSLCLLWTGTQGYTLRKWSRNSLTVHWLKSPQ